MGSENESLCIVWLTGWFKKEQVISDGEGVILAISWCGPLIAYANERGVRIYDEELQMKIFKLPVS